MSEVKEWLHQIWRIDWLRCVAYGASGCFLGFSFNIGGFYNAKFFLLPFFFMAALFERAYIRSSFLFWLGYFSVALSWLVQPLMIDLSAYSALIPIARLGIPAYFSLLLVIPVYLVRKYISGGRIFQFWPLVFAEFAMMYFIGHGELGFPWALPGYCDGSDRDFVRFAFWGLYGETLFWLVLSGTSAYFFYPIIVSRNRFDEWKKENLKKRCDIMIKFLENDYQKVNAEDLKFEDNEVQNRSCIARKSIYFSILTIFCSTLIFYSVTSSSVRISHNKPYNNQQEFTDYKIRCVHIPISQRNRINPNLYSKNFQSYLNLSFSDDKVDFVIWPEANIPWLLKDDSPQIRQQLARVVPKDGYLLTGAVRQDFTGCVYNSLVAINQLGETVAYYDKKHLAPFGEYIPFRRFIPKFLDPIASNIGDFDRGKVSNIITVKGLKIAVAICYEAVFPGTIVPADEDIDAILVVSNDAWFGEKGTESKQYTNIVRMRAVEEGIPVIKVSNCGSCVVFDSDGHTVSPESADGLVSTYRLPKKRKHKTLYKKIQLFLDETILRVSSI